MAKIKLKTSENVAEIFGDFLISRKTKGADKFALSLSELRLLARTAAIAHDVKFHPVPYSCVC